VAAPAEGELREPSGRAARELVDRYAAAFENADVDTLMGLLTHDAVLEMPPQPDWFTGRAVIGRFLARRVLTEPGRFRLIPTSANGDAAAACYLRDSDGVYRAHGIQVLTLTGAGVAHVVSFNDPGLLAVFGLPPVLSAAAALPFATSASPAGPQ
jgi:RNA polymerase sigma-70 factor (ECF subfamily)